MRKPLLLLISHLIIGIIGFGAGIYLLPILTEPTAPTVSEVKTTAQNAQYTGEFRRDLKDSDTLHWGEGTVFVSSDSIALHGKTSPGPAYKLYLSPEFVETEKHFLQLKPKMAAIGDIKTFTNFIIPIPKNINPDEFNTVVIWCESFNEFITAAKYR